MEYSKRLKRNKHLITLCVFGLGIPTLALTYELTGAPPWCYVATFPALLLVAIGRTINIARGNFRRST